MRSVQCSRQLGRVSQYCPADPNGAQLSILGRLVPEAAVFIMSRAFEGANHERHTPLSDRNY